MEELINNLNMPHHLRVRINKLVEGKYDSKFIYKKMS